MATQDSGIKDAATDNPPPSEKPRKKRNVHLQRVLDHVWGPTGSVIIHIVVIILLITVVSTERQMQNPDIQVMMMDPTTTELDKQIDEELTKLDEQKPVEESTLPPEASLSSDVAPGLEGESTGQGAAEGFGADDNSMDFGSALDIRSDVQGALVMRGLFAGRSASGRAAGLSKYGRGSAAFTEPAVNRALEWLKNHQADDGGWSKDKNLADRIGHTGLAILTFLAHGETTGSEKYGNTVMKGIQFLMAQQQDDGFLGGTGRASGAAVYAHAIATYALSEAYGLTRIPMLKPVMEKGAQIIIAGQQATGGWDYGYKKDKRRDTSVSGWQIQALKAAYIAKAETPGIKAAFSNALEDLKRSQDAETGTFGYTDAGGRKSPKERGMTGVAVLCMELMGHAEDLAARSGINALDQATADWDEPMNSPFYAWYYITQAKFHRGGSTWDAWNNRIAPTLVKNQSQDGSWPKTRTQSAVGEESDVYRTTLACLTLQVYYRNLPTYQAVPVETPTTAETNDVVIKIL